MTDAGFYQPRKTSPTALAIVVLMHGAALTALALAKTEVFRDPIDRIKLIDIDEAKAPPPEPARPVERARTPVQDIVIDRPPPIVDTSFTGPATEWKPQPMPTLVIPEPGPTVAPAIDPPSPPARKIESARARANLASYVSDSDYPSSAIRDEEQGTTRFRLAVGADGRVTDCTVTRSSGSSALDSTTCRLMKSRARFTPARDSDGRPTGDTVANAIRWVLPD